tara:strand:- start:344 stop:535 length:192 start_codon:yes stop_codon:yes gene_type:complete
MIKLANQETTETMTRLIRNDFDKIDFSQEYIYNRAAILISTALQCGLYELAVDMETDKRTELC